MKRSELTTEIGTYRLSPASWGTQFIMIHEDEVRQVTSDAFDMSVEDCDPDDSKNGTLDEVTIWTTDDGKFYAVLIPFKRGGEWYNNNMYKSCQDPAEATLGSSDLYGIGWENFDDEEATE